MHKWSPFQEKIFDTYRYTNSNIVISATAGASKTTSLVQMLKYKSPLKSTFLTSFSVAIVNELKQRVPPTVQVKTVHSVGMSALMRYYSGSVVVDEAKTIKMVYHAMKNVVDPNLPKSKKLFNTNVAKLIDLWRLYDCDTTDDLTQYALANGVDCSEMLIRYAMMCWESICKYNDQSNFDRNNKLRIDFVDMLYLTLKKNLPLTKYDEVIVDECQDNSKLQQQLVRRMMRPLTGRGIFVGDPKQCIYSFQGADPEAFDNWRRMPNTVELTLPVSYRCSKAVVDEANKIFPGETVAWENAKDGEVVEGSIDDAQSGDFVLCRNNAPLFEAYFHFMSLNKKATLKDKEFTESLIAALEPFTAKGHYGPLQVKSELLEDLEKLRVELERRGVQRPEYHASYVKALERLDIIDTLFEYYSTAAEVLAGLKSMLTDNDKDSIQLMTFHKSKGLESPNVYLIRLDLWPSQFANTEVLLQQERNLMFVAITRSSDRLIRDRTFTKQTLKKRKKW